MRRRQFCYPHGRGRCADGNAKPQCKTPSQEHGAVLCGGDDRRSQEDDEAAYAHACASPKEVARGACEECAYALADNIDEKDWTIQRIRTQS